MNASVVILLCSVVGSTLGYYVQREAPYNTGPNDPYSVGFNPYDIQEPSQRLFWGNSGSNQVGGTGLWASLTNKFPFLNNMFGRMELPSQYGVPNQPISTQYGVPPRFQQPQFYQSVPYYQQQFQNPNQFGPSGRDVALTDDAVIITPPQVPILPPAPAPAPFPNPSPNPTPGYQYNIPQQRLELPRNL